MLVKAKQHHPRELCQQYDANKLKDSSQLIELINKLCPSSSEKASLIVDASLEPKKPDGFVVKKPLLYASLGLLGLAFLMRMKGFK